MFTRSAHTRYVYINCDLFIDRKLFRKFTKCTMSFTEPVFRQDYQTQTSSNSHHFASEKIFHTRRKQRGIRDNPWGIPRRTTLTPTVINGHIFLATQVCSTLKESLWQYNQEIPFWGCRRGIGFSRGLWPWKYLREGSRIIYMPRDERERRR